MAKKIKNEEPLEKQLWKAADKLRKNIDAAEIGLSRQGLQEAISAKGNPRLDNINAIIRAMGYQFMPRRLENSTA
jgi:DNA-binding phage protein